MGWSIKTGSTVYSSDIEMIVHVYAQQSLIQTQAFTVPMGAVLRIDLYLHR